MKIPLWLLKKTIVKGIVGTQIISHMSYILITNEMFALHNTQNNKIFFKGIYEILYNKLTTMC